MKMIEIIELIMLIGPYIGLLVLSAYGIAMLLIMTISLVYFAGYVYDTICGKFLYRWGIALSNKFVKLKQIKILRKIKRWMKPKNLYLRYETPLCTYCFSLTAVLIIGELIDGMQIGYGIVIAYVIYIVVYFIGMYRRYDDKINYYKALDNNLDFLKLSFVPLTFLITIVGFIFTILGFNIQEVDYNYFEPVIEAISELGLIEGLASEVWTLIGISLGILMLMYILSIPMQLISYFIILVINYFRKYAMPYKKLIKKYLKIVEYFNLNI